MNFRLLGICAGLTLVFCGAIINTNVASAQTPKTIPLKFKPGTTSMSVSGSIKGDASNDYQFRAAGGQMLKVDLTAKNTSLYFNILPAENQTTGEALSAEPPPTQVTTWQGKLPKDGEYIIRVYLMRAAARRGTAASYSLKVEIK